MTQEEKQLLLIDLCARLPYGVKGKLRDSNYTAILKDVRYSCYYPLLVRPIECPLTNDECSLGVYEFKPFLRPMSSMTDEEKDEFDKLMNLVEERCINAYGKGGYTLSFTELNDWLNKNKFDYRGLIKKGLALEAKEGMYKTE